MDLPNRRGKPRNRLGISPLEEIGHLYYRENEYARCTCGWKSSKKSVYYGKMQFLEHMEGNLKFDLFSELHSGDIVSHSDDDTFSVRKCVRGNEPGISLCEICDNTGNISGCVLY